MPEPPPVPSRFPRALLALLPLLVLLAHAFWGFSYDDAFITYRYAANWAAHQGLVYNPGELTLGTTAPGYALLLGLLAHLPISIPAWGTLLSLSSLFLLSATVALPGRTTAALLFGAFAATFRWNLEMLGTETLPVLALIAASAYLACERGTPRAQVAAGLLAAAAMALRLDAALGAAAIGLVLWTVNRRPPVRFAAAGLIPLAAWLAWLVHLFGTFLPNTFAAKRAELALTTHGYTISQWLWLRRGLPLPACIALLALAAAGLAVGLRSGALKKPLFAALGLWIALHEILYRVAGVPFAPWYEEALLQAVLFLAVLAALALGACLAAYLPRGLPPGARDGIAWGLAVLTLLPVLVPSLADLGRQWGRAPDPRFGVYRQVGQFLAGDAGCRPAAVAAPEIGVVGYVSGLRVLDLGGLISPRVLAARAAGRLPDLLAAERPEYLVDVPAFRNRGLAAFLARPEEAAAYRPVAAFTSPEYGGGIVRVLRRR